MSKSRSSLEFLEEEYLRLCNEQLELRKLAILIYGIAAPVITGLLFFSRNNLEGLLFDRITITSIFLLLIGLLYCVLFINFIGSGYHRHCVILHLSNQGKLPHIPKKTTSYQNIQINDIISASWKAANFFQFVLPSFISLGTAYVIAGGDDDLKTACIIVSLIVIGLFFITGIIVRQKKKDASSFYSQNLQDVGILGARK